MLSWFSSRSADRSKATDLYGAVVAAARREHFYRECGIPDTPEGRFELILLHLGLLTDRLTALGEDGQKLARVMLETFVRDMDDNMREMGVSDLGVPRKVIRAAAALYERTLALREGLDAKDGLVLEQTLLRMVPEAGTTGARLLASYFRQARAALALRSAAELLSGRVTFPDPGLSQPALGAPGS